LNTDQKANNEKANS